MREDSNHCETFLLSAVPKVTGFTVIMEYKCDQLSTMDISNIFCSLQCN